MKRALFAALFGLALAGCTEPSRPDVQVAPESTALPLGQLPASAKPADTAGTAPAPATAEPKPAATAEATAAATATAAPAASSSAAASASKPGGCLQDSECGAGQVCEACAEGKCCTQGCRSDAQCGAGQHCRRVDCIRAPCPSRCEGGNAPPGRGSPPGRSTAPEK
jgi:hypothetical protein